MTEPPKRIVKRQKRHTKPANSCECGQMTVTITRDEAIIRGAGWCKENQWAVCGKCSTAVRYAPLLIWETPSGLRYSSRGYLSEDAKSRKV